MRAHSTVIPHRLCVFLAVAVLIAASTVTKIGRYPDRIPAGENGRPAIALPLLLVFIGFLVMFARQRQRGIEADERRRWPTNRGARRRRDRRDRRTRRWPRRK